MVTRRALVMVAAAAATALLARSTARRLGAPVKEVRKPLAGDDLLPDAQVQTDRACTVSAPPHAVWPWIAQLGQDKAGFYSFETLENLAGCEITNATSIHPEWQHPAKGDAFRLHPDLALRVALVEPGKFLVVTSHGGEAPGEMAFDLSWEFHLEPTPCGTGSTGTRLHLRERYETRNTTARLMIEVTTIVSAIMTWRMLTRISNLASQHKAS